MIKNVRGCDDLVGLRGFDEVEQAAFDGIRRTHSGAQKRHAGGGLLGGRPVRIDVFDRWRNLGWSPTAKICEGLLDRSEKKARLGVSFGDDGIQAQHSVWAVELP